jgi:hypothetical protein
LDKRKPDGQYVVFSDIAIGEGGTASEGDWHAVQVLDHVTRQQVARYRSRIPVHDLPLVLFMIARYFNGAWLAPEINGPGQGVIDALNSDYGYSPIYRRHRSGDDQRNDAKSYLLGWQTTQPSKYLMEQTFGSALSRGLAWPAGRADGPGVLDVRPRPEAADVARRAAGRMTTLAISVHGRAPGGGGAPAAGRVEEEAGPLVAARRRGVLVIAQGRVVLMQRDNPLNIYDSPENDVFEAKDLDGRFLLKLPFWNTMVGPWQLVEREHRIDTKGQPYVIGWIVRPA